MYITKHFLHANHGRVDLSDVLQIADIEKACSERCTAYKASAAAASNEHSASEYELTKEREAHLATLKDLRRASEQMRYDKSMIHCIHVSCLGHTRMYGHADRVVSSY